MGIRRSKGRAWRLIHDVRDDNLAVILCIRLLTISVHMGIPPAPRYAVPLVTVYGLHAIHFWLQSSLNRLSETL